MTPTNEQRALDLARQAHASQLKHEEAMAEYEEMMDEYQKQLDELYLMFLAQDPAAGHDRAMARARLESEMYDRKKRLRVLKRAVERCQIEYLQYDRLFQLALRCAEESRSE